MRTAPSRRCAWILAPSSLYSTDAVPVASSAAATSVAGDASIGCTALPGTMPTAAERLDAPGHGGLGGDAEIAGQHVRPTHGVDRHAGRPGDGVDHHTVERALAQLAAEHAPEQALLGPGRPSEHLAEQRRAAPR